MENSSHAPGNIPEESGTRQRHRMGEGGRAMGGENFGISEFPGTRTIGGHGDHMPHDGVRLHDSNRAGPPALPMGDESMHATAHSRHGPHGHAAKHHDLVPDGTRPHHVGGSKRSHRAA